MIESKCDMCGEFKLREFSFFTDRMWYCSECKPIVLTNQLSCRIALRHCKEDCKNVSEILLYLIARGCSQLPLPKGKGL